MYVTHLFMRKHFGNFKKAWIRMIKMLLFDQRWILQPWWSTNKHPSMQNNSTSCFFFFQFRLVVMIHFSCHYNKISIVFYGLKISLTHCWNPSLPRISSSISVTIGMLKKRSIFSKSTNCMVGRTWKCTTFLKRLKVLYTTSSWKFCKRRCFALW